MRTKYPLHEWFLFLANIVLILLGLGFFIALAYAATLIALTSNHWLALGVALGASGFGGLAVIGMLEMMRR